MDKDEKIKHLESLINKVERLRCNERDIDKLSELINSELRNELAMPKQNHTYIFNLNRTIKGQLSHLNESRKKPENRISEMNECKSHFKQDIGRYIGDLKFT
jgi:vacuolar-type H+-ATPase subunit I/STV1